MSIFLWLRKLQKKLRALGAKCWELLPLMTGGLVLVANDVVHPQMALCHCGMETESVVQ